ncbi:MAG TPA: DinB family protein [Gemmatimonadales bacterium]|nr:DinB family protein [Gemmatimonadales bacterium]
MPEFWLQGPVPGIIPDLQPAAHALLQVRQELPSVLARLDASLLWVRPGGAASLGFHLLHIAGSTDRLLTYAAGQGLSDAQRQALSLEREPEASGRTLQELTAGAVAAIDQALDVLRSTRAEELDDARTVGRQALPTNVRGLLFHIAEHAQRHSGQVATTVKVVAGLRSQVARGVTHDS